MIVERDTIHGVLWHRVIPESEEEAKIAGEFLTPDEIGGFLDLGNPDGWQRFTAAIRNLDFNRLFDSTLRG